MTWTPSSDSWWLITATGAKALPTELAAESCDRPEFRIALGTYADVTKPAPVDEIPKSLFEEAA